MAADPSTERPVDPASVDQAEEPSLVRSGGVREEVPAWQGPAPGGPRVAANLAALETLRRVQREGRAPTAGERDTLAGWRSWGAVPQVFDETRAEFEPVRAWLRQTMTSAEYTAARRTVLNAHYTDPALIAPIWNLLREFGYDPTRHEVLEPGCGHGGFLAHAPGGLTRFTGIELDPVTADIAAVLHEDATILAESFADTRQPAGRFDVAVGNVPFSDVVLHDPAHNPGRLSMHNHFIVKSLDLVAAGGIVAVLTSRYTLDARNPAAREAIHDRADLLGAIRLPTGAHRGYAGTDAVTDLLILRRRAAGATALEADWLESLPHPDVDGERINAHFHAHPERVLGQLLLGSGAYGARTVTVAAEDPLRAAATGLAAGLSDIAAQAPVGASGRVLDTDLDRVLGPTPMPVARAGEPALTVGWLDRDGEGAITRRTATGVELAGVPATQQREVGALLGLRDAALALLTAQAETFEDTPAMDQLRAVLNERYDDYVTRWGPINRYKVSVRGPEEREVRLAPPAVRVLRGDPFGATVKALEVFDDETQTAGKAAIFTTRVVALRTVPVSAASPADALAISLDQRASVDLDFIADLLDTTAPAAREQLVDLVFADPDLDGRLVPRPEYLSGDVRAKLKAAQEAAGADPAYASNVAALAEVIPADVGPGDIAVRLGAVWVPAEDVQAFLAETLDDDSVTVHHYGGSEWSFSGRGWTVAATQEWGTDDRSAFDLAEALSTQRPIVIRRTVRTADGERSVVDPAATALAQDRAQRLNDRFGEWLWEDPDRAARLAERYNARFNAIVVRDYDTTRLSLPGLAATFTPRPHQLAAVARMVFEPSVGLFHEVGAGKTAEMVIGCMELRRLGIVHKPAVVVPNHMLEQFEREWLQLYPQAQLLAASSQDVTKERRADFVARAATGDWDAILITQSAFSRLPVSPEAEANHIAAAGAAVHARLAQAQANRDTRTVKRAERQALAAEEKRAQLLNRPQDAGITFEQTGIDYLCVDELHQFKNLEISSADRSLAGAGSQRATDLDLKIELLRQRAGRNGRVMTGATATPIANSVAEMYVMQHYLRPDLLAAAGIADFDSWANTFGTVVTDLELDPTGTNYRTSSRFAQFKNVPELLRLWSVAGDVKTAEDLRLPTPPLAARGDGARIPEVISVEPTEATSEYVADLVDRAQAVRDGAVTPQEDNMLAITTDGRTAALDLRLLDRASRAYPPQRLDPPGTPTKVTVAADHIHQIWADVRDRVYSGADAAPHPVPGGLQIVFCDLGTPTTDGTWNVYDGLRSELADRGMDPRRTRFVHEARNDAEKARLFEACRSGQVDVLIGSTEKMGVGTNIQARAVALHHLDCPWRPADIAQREGRIVRQGNQNPEVRILRYVTTRTFDSYLWQTVERKAKFIAQVMRGRLDVREIEDVGNAALSFAEVKAIGSGDPNTLRRAQAEAAVTKLERAAGGHARGQALLRTKIGALHDAIDQAERDIPQLHQAIEGRVDTTGERFTLTLNGVRHTTRSDAAAALDRTVRDLFEQVPVGGHREHPGLVTVAGHPFTLDLAKPVYMAATATFTVPDVPGTTLVLDPAGLGDGRGLVARLENRISGLDATLRTAEQTLTSARRELDRATLGLGVAFPQADELAAARSELSAVLADITAAAEDHAAVEAATDEPLTVDQAAHVTTRADQLRTGAARPRTLVEVHQHLYRDVHPEAGQHRGEAKDTRALEALFTRLQQVSPAGRERDEWITTAATLYTRLCREQPFHDGNERAAREALVAAACGHQHAISWSSETDWAGAARRGDSGPLRAHLDTALTRALPAAVTASFPASSLPTRGSGARPASPPPRGRHGHEPDRPGIGR